MQLLYLPDKDFIGVRAVKVGSVKESDAGFNGVVDEVDHFWFRFWESVVT